jgi:SpoVK/Ycf46/Vps4 family AAA+-type ATPase
VARPFTTDREHLYAELGRIDLVIQREIWRWRQANPAQPGAGDEFRGLYVSEAEIDAILDGVYPGSTRVADEVAGVHTESAFGQAIDRAASEIAARKAMSAEQGLSLRLEGLRARFGLTPFDVDVLLIATAPELELRYERLYAYLQDDVTRKRPGVAMTLNLLCATPDDRVTARERFAPGAPLIRHGLIDLLSDPTQPHAPLLAQYVKPDRRVIDWLTQEGDREGCDARLRGYCESSSPTAQLDTLHLLPEVTGQLVYLRSLLGVEPPRAQGPASPCAASSQSEGIAGLPVLALLIGDPGTAKMAAAEAVCAAWGRPLLTVHLSRLLARASDWRATLQRAVREAYLTGAALYWHDYDAWAGEEIEEDPEHALRRDALHAALLRYPVASFLPVEDVERQPDPALLRAPHLVRVNLPRPAYRLRCTLWRHSTEEYETAPDLAYESVAGRFRLTDDQIRDAALDAHHRAAQRPPDQRAVTEGDLFAAARARTSEQLRHLAKKIEPRHTWSDLVLPPDPVTQLHEMCDQMRYRPLVLGEWGFDRKLSLGKGLNALFAGPSGTGKTMAAEVIACDLGLDLYKIDLSTVVSKYVGETEKNMERIFTAARNSNAILFFDEADALFGKRSEVRDAHDRYANVEISYLLQKMEEYDGLVILTSNLNKNMDEAFVRRMHFTVEFPYPEQEARREIWAITFPTEAPVSLEVDLDLLAERYRLTGGNIRNVVLTAAFLAARDGGVIGMDHLLWATRREFQKMGRLADEREFEL